MIAIGLGSYSYMLYHQHSMETQNTSAYSDPSSSLINSFNGAYELSQPGQKSILHIDGLTRNNEVRFTFFVVNSAGEIFDKTGVAELKSRTRAVFKELQNNCEIELLFIDNRVNVVQNNCIKEGFSSFAGTYLRK
jgi:hypothetical protein